MTSLGWGASRAIAAYGIGLLAAVSVAACGAPDGTTGVGGAGNGGAASPSGGPIGAPEGGSRGAVPGTSGGNSGGPASPKGQPRPSGTSDDGSAQRPSGAPGDVPRCRAGRLDVTVRRTEPAAGNRYATIVFTNEAGRRCDLVGYPGVSVLRRDRTRIGPTAERAPGNPVTRVVLAPGESASTVVHWASRAAGTCRQTSSYLRAFPPGSRKSIVVPATIRLCGGVFDVRALTKGTDGIAGKRRS